MKEFSEETFEQIDLYLNDRMNPVDRSGFESMMASDLDLKHEVELQKDIVKSIRKKEINRIKSHLNTVGVTLTPVMLQTSSLVAYAVAAAVGLGTYVTYSYYDNDDNPMKTASPIEEQGGHVNFYEDPETQNSNALKDESMAIITERKNEEGNKIKGFKGDDPSGETPESHSENANPLAVDDHDVEDDFNKKDVNVKSNPTSNKQTSGSEVELVIKNRRGKRVEYQFYDDKLYLYGNFKPSEPYVIYDIPTNYGTEYYFKIAKKYYKLTPNQVERKELEPITNPKLIKELDRK